MSELPKGWAVTTLKNLFEVKYGKGLPNRLRDTSGTVPVYGSNGIVGKHNEALTAGSTILIGRKGSAGEVHLSEQPCWAIDTTYYVDDFYKVLPPKYWFYFLRSLRLGQHDQSSAIPSVRREEIYAVDVPVPPLNEQKRIIAKLDELLPKVEACKQRLEKIPTILKRFRQSVLADAVSGKLTETWRVENELPDWRSSVLGNELLFVGSGITPKGGREVYVTSGVKFIRSQNVYPFQLTLDDVAFVTPELHEAMARTHIMDGDVLLNITGASIGRCAVVPSGFGNANVNQHVCILRTKETLLPDYLCLFLNSPIGQSLVFETQVGVTREGLNYGQIRAFDISVPSIEEQQEICRKTSLLFDRYVNFATKLEATEKFIKKVGDAILSKAFSGSLVDQDPNDEPASSLLERIKASSTPKPKKSAPKKRKAEKEEQSLSA